jgi:hypothetical protein
VRLALEALGALEGPSAEADLDRALQLMAEMRLDLLKIKARLEVIMRDGTDPDEAARASLELLTVQRELELLDQRRRALVDGVATLRPPRDEDIAQAQRRAQDLAEVLSQDAKVAALAGLAADLARLSERLVV